MGKGTPRDAKQFLEQYKLLNAAINSKQGQLSTLRGRISQITTSQGGDGSKNSHCVGDKLGVLVGKIMDLEGEINSDIDRLVDLQRKIEGVIAEVGSDTMRLILTLRYINCSTWEEIARLTNYSHRNVQYLHRKALAAVKIFA